MELYIKRGITALPAKCLSASNRASGTGESISMGALVCVCAKADIFYECLATIAYGVDYAGAAGNSGYFFFIP